VNVAKLVSLAFVMVAGPQMLTAIFLATTPKWRQNSASFVLGAALSITTITTLAFLLGTGASDQGTSNTTLNIVILVLLLAAAWHKFATRKQSKPPKWMGELEAATPGMAFRLGFLLLGIFPSDILTSIAVGGYVVSHHEPWWQILPFVLMTLLLLAIPSLLLLVLGRRAQAFLPKARDWMSANSWVISEIVLALFIVLTLGSL
jgi:hypothetical protein